MSASPIGLPALMRDSAYAPEAEAAVEAVVAAGELLRRRQGGALNTREKGDRSLVTDADLAAEAEILERIRRAFPADPLLSEEAGALGVPSGRQWIVDPLDGTTNYSRGLPFFAVSLALWDSGEPVLAAVYLPVLDELFTAARDTPALLNGRPIGVSGVTRVRDAMLNVYFDRHGRLDAGLDLLRRAALECEGRIKVLGSTASLLCYVACGRLDGFLRNATRIWDFAAGSLILTRAGGMITDFDEAPLRRSGQSLLATNGRIHSALAAIARGA